MAKRVYYTGAVQGVGFRATAASIARRHAVRGWVRNLADGRVELLADGSAAAVEDFLADIRDRMADCIESEDSFEQDVGEPLDGFRIVH
jgi:acylphosphatase